MASAGAIRVRRATEGDAAVFVDLLQRGFAETRAEANPSSALKETEAQVRRWLQEHHGALAAVGGTPVGSVRFRILELGHESHESHESAMSAERRLFFERLVVTPEQRRRGVARALLAFLEGFAIEAGATHLVLTARSQQPDNRPLWRRLGFTVTGYGERYGIPDLVTHMQRPVGRGGP